jgi:hypothetical protein
MTGDCETTGKSWKNIKSCVAEGGALLVAGTVQVSDAQAGWMNDLNFKGSLGENGFKHYVPPVSNPLFNETPFITTEVRPIWLHNDILKSSLLRAEMSISLP